MVQFNETLTELQNAVYQKFQNMTPQVLKNLWRSYTERIVYKAGDYISRNISDKAKNESIVLRAQLENLQNSYNKISSDLETERTRKVKDLREVEKKNATLKTTMKMIEEKFNLNEKSKIEEINNIKEEMHRNEVR